MRYPARPIRVLVLPLPGPATISAGVGAAMAACWNSSGWEERSRGDEGDRKGPLPTSSTAPALTMDESASSGDEGDTSVPTELGSPTAGDASVPSPRSPT